MPDHTTTSAAEYLAARGYTVSRRRAGGEGPPTADTIKHWCERGTITARKAGWVWLIDQDELDALLARYAAQRRPAGRPKRTKEG